jgi:glycosyltransferase involved in cell wall biosynthesis
MSSSNGLRVLHIGKFYPPHIGGMEFHLQTLCGELRRFLDVSVLVANDGAHSIEETNGGVPVRRVGTLCNLASASVCPGMIQAIRASEADLIHMHLPNPTAVLAYLASGHKARLVVTWHLDIVRQKVLGLIFRPFERIFMRRCQAIVASSPNYIQSSAVLSAYRARCQVIPFGIRTEELESADAPSVSAIRKRFGDRIVLAIGRLVYYKGFEYLIRAMSEIDGRLLLIGDGPLRNRLEQEARAARTGDRVVFLGKIPGSLGPFYHAADVFVLPSVARSEAFGIVQVEAMAAGVPVVNTRIASGVPFVSLDGVTGLTVPPGDPHALAQAVNSLLGDPDRRARLGRAARRRAKKEFSLNKMTRRILALYERVMSTQAWAA